MGKQSLSKDEKEGLQQLLGIQSAILDASGDFIVACDTNFKTIYANPGAYKMTGYTFEEIGYNFSPEIVHSPEDAEWVRKAQALALEKGFAQGETELITKDGRKIDVQQQYFALRDAEGNVFGVGMVARDVSMLRGYARDLLTKSAIIDSSDDFIAATDVNMNCIYGNPGVYAMSGYDPDDIGLDIGPPRMHDEETAKKIGAACMDVINNGVKWQGESEFICSDGRILNIQQKLFPLKDEKGRITGTGTIIRDFTEIRAAQDEAAKMLGVLKNILNAMDANIYVSDLITDEILFVNKRMRDSYGLGEDVAGKTCWQVMQRDMTGRCDFCPINQLTENPDTPVEWEILNPVTNRYYKNTDAIIDWADGKKAHLQYSIDITDSKAAQREADNALNVLKNIMDGMDAYVYVSDLVTDEIFFINRRMREAFHLDGEAVGQTCWKVLQDGLTERCSFCPNPRLEQNPGESVVWEECNTVTGRYYKNVDSIIEWKDGVKAHMQHSTDITDILEAQEETRETRNRLEIALNSSQAGVWEMDFTTDTITYDQMCARLFGFDRWKKNMSIDALIEHLQNVLRGVTGEDVIEGLKMRDPYQENTSRDLHLVFPGGTERYLRNFGYTLRDDHCNAVRVIGMCIDITQQVSMEHDLMAAKETAEHASVAKSQFLSNMSHEIRTPMNAIIGMAELLMNESLSGRQMQYVSDIQVSSTALLGIINDILDFSKIEAGKLQLIPVDYDFKQLLENIRSMFEFTAQSKGLYFKMNAEGELPHCLFGDDIRLRQALVNILGNAVKFTKEGGVTMDVSTEGGMVRFDISDTGIGIKRDEIGKIFGDFDQLDARNNRSIGGTGLGLSITKNLIGMMDGSIEAESDYGKGTVFHLSIPLIPGDPQKLREEEEEGVQVSAPDAKVLVVDDNEVNLSVASGLLRLSGIACDTALSGQEAIEMVNQKDYDIVFMDQMMPGMDGVETTAELRKQHGEKLVVVALTANAVEGARESLLAAGMNDYLSKPIDRADLNNILLRWLPADKVSESAMEAQIPQELPELFQKLAQIEGLDVALGLERISGMTDVYEKSLRIFTRRLPDVVARLVSFLKNADMKGFSIEVHGAKGSLNNIGATNLALQAEALEHKSKAGDAAYCEENLPALTAGLMEMQGKLEAVLEEGVEQAPTKGKGNKKDMVMRISVARGLLDAFEGDEALDTLCDLRRYDYGEELNAALQTICRKTEEFDYETAMAIIDDICAGGVG